MSKGLLWNKRFWPTFWTMFLGAFNDNVYKNAMVLLIAYKSYTLLGLNPGAMVSLAGGIFILPFFLFSATSGQICDKMPKHKLMVIVKIWEILVMFLGTTGFLLGNVKILMTALFLMGTQSTVFGPVKYSILPELINEDELVEGNALFQMGTFVSILLGTILGGVLISIQDIGPQYVSIAVIVLAILGTLTATKIQELPANEPDLKIQYGVIKPTWNIIKLTLEKKEVFLGVFGISWYWFYGAALLTIFPLYVKNILSSNEHVATLFLAIFSIGVAIGSVICGKLSKNELEVGLVPVGAIGLSLFPIDLFLIGKPSFAIAAGELFNLSQFLKNPIAIRILFDLLMISIFSGFYIVPLYTLIQQRSRAEIRSRIIAGNNILNALFMVVASIMLMICFGKGITEPQMYMILSIQNALVCLYMFKSSHEYLDRFRKIIGRFLGKKA
jgi:MFS family permease